MMVMASVYCNGTRFLTQFQRCFLQESYYCSLYFKLIATLVHAQMSSRARD